MGEHRLISTKSVNKSERQRPKGTPRNRWIWEVREEGWRKRERTGLECWRSGRGKMIADSMTLKTVGYV